MGAKADVTIEYYNRNVARFLEDTVGVEFTEIQNAFLNLLPEGARILDFGCGSGRDALEFLKRGYQVDKVDEERIRFPWFTLTGEDGEAEAYMQLISALADMARNSKRITAKEKDVENEKYAFRCFLLRLGFIGQEYKTTRKVLMKNLEGNAAWKNKYNSTYF